MRKRKYFFGYAIHAFNKRAGQMCSLALMFLPTSMAIDWKLRQNNQDPLGNEV